MKKILLVLVLTLAVCSAVSAQTEARATRTWEVQKYDIVASLPTSDTDRYLNSRATLSLRNASAAPVTSLTLRINPAAEVAGVKINGATGDFTKGEEKVGGGTLQRIIMRGIAVSPGGTLTVEVTYKLKVAANSGVNTISPVGALFLPLAFWYPTPNSWFFARGADYAPMKVQIDGLNGLTVISSGSEFASGSFEQKLSGQPFFVTGSWETATAGGVTALYPKGEDPEVAKRAAEMAQLASDAKAFMSGFFGGGADSPVRIVAVRRGGGFASAGTILLDESAFRRSKIDALTAVTIAESVAKMWLGGAVKIDGDGGGVIREGLSRYLATQFIEAKFGKDEADIERLRQRTAYAAVVRRDAALSAVTPLDDYYYATTTNKGAMIWRLLASKLGPNGLSDVVKSAGKDGVTDLAEMRGLLASQKEVLDYLLDQVTDMDLLVGLPQSSGGQTTVALRNTGGIDANVDVVATTANGERIRVAAVVPKQGFGTVAFKNNAPVARVEIDAEKLLPQTDYSNDVAPREIDESDLVLFAKKPFDRQDFATAEKNARSILSDKPRFDDVRVILARALLAEDKTADAEREFTAVLNEKLPTARSLAWANVGLGDIAAKNNRVADAIRYYEQAVRADAGANFLAQQGKSKLNAPAAVDDVFKNFFVQFDKAAISSVRANVDTLIIPGEEVRFAGGVAGQAREWASRIVRVEKLSANLVLVEVSLNLRMINKEAESGTAVFRMMQTGGGWKIYSVDSFEVR